MTTPLGRLLSIAGPPLGKPVDGETVRTATPETGALEPLWNARNGFYAFESALHVYPLVAGDGMELSIAEWNEPPLWRRAYGEMAVGHLFFAEDVFGGQFSLRAGEIFMFDPETGASHRVASDLEDWAEALLADYEFLTGYPVAHEWQARHGPLPPGHRLVPKLPFVLGGEYTIDNVYPVEAAEGMRLRGELGMQLLDLPDGSRVTYRVVE